MDFETELRKITEAYCVHANIPIRRRFTDEELQQSLERVREAVEREQPLELSDFSPHTQVSEMGPLELDNDPDYARQDAAARRSPTNHPHRAES